MQQWHNEERISMAQSGKDINGTMRKGYQWHNEERISMAQGKDINGTIRKGC